MGGGSYSLDPAELAEVIRELRECRRLLERHVDDLRIQVRRLHETWDGLSAEAHVVAQAAIDDGLAAMNAALGEFVQANEDARAGYAVVWDANVAIWQAVQ
jgi:uncharacterized protein YukE